jgi:hypothetical protein
MRLSTDQRSRPAFRLHAVTVAPITQKGDDMSLLPSMFNATPSEVAAFRAHMRDRYHVPPDTPPDKAETAFERLADLIVSYLSSPVPSAPDPPCRVGACITCGKDDCFATAEPWAAKLIYLDGEAYVSGGLCCERPWAKGHQGRCAPSDGREIAHSKSKNLPAWPLSSES